MTELNLGNDAMAQTVSGSNIASSDLEPAAPTLEPTNMVQRQTTNPMTMASLSRVPVTIEVQLGSSRLMLPQMLSLEPGSTLTLDQGLGAPVTLYVNGCAIAKGDLYVLEESGEKLGVKITELFAAAN